MGKTQFVCEFRLSRLPFEHDFKRFSSLRNFNVKFIRVDYLCALVFILSSFPGICGQKYTPNEYLSLFKEEAVHEMLKHGIPASITLAQAMLESSNGNSDLAQNANNHFGIKCHEGWNGSTYIYDDDEKNECFRKYEDPLESFHDHSLFLKNRPRYAFLFSFAKTDYKSWAKGLKEAGYATNPKYADLLIDLIERYHLVQFDVLEEMAAYKNNVKYSPPAFQHAKLLTKTPISIDVNNYIALKNIIVYKKVAAVMVSGKAEELKEINKPIPAIDELTGNDIKTTETNSKELFHIVAEGETLQSIALLYKIRPRTLNRLNKLKRGQKLFPGEILSISGRKNDKIPLSQN